MCLSDRSDTNEGSPMEERIFNSNCPVGVTMKILSGKWKIWILFMLAEGPKRFNELQRMKEGLTQRMLTMHLRELEQDKIIVRTAYSVVPPKVEYSLSDLGQTLKPLLDDLQKWGAYYIDEMGLKN